MLEFPLFPRIHKLEFKFSWSKFSWMETWMQNLYRVYRALGYPNKRWPPITRPVFRCTELVKYYWIVLFKERPSLLSGHSLHSRKLGSRKLEFKFVYTRCKKFWWIHTSFGGRYNKQNGIFGRRGGWCKTCIVYTGLNSHNIWEWD
jgi:hypothetical protein